MQHPLEPLRKDEIEKAVTIFKTQGNGSRDNCVFSCASLIEPSKGKIKQFKATPDVIVSRLVRLVGVGGTEFGNGGFSADVDLTNNIVVLVNRLENNAQAPYSLGDFNAAYTIVLGNEGCREAMLKRGITEDDLKNEVVEIDSWPGGGFVHPSIPKGHRSLRALFFYRECPLKENMYSRPISNLIVHVDLTDGKVTHIEDLGHVPIPHYNPTDQYNIEENIEVKSQRQMILKPLEIIQPEGPSFSVNGHNIKWAHWDFRISMHPLHGLVLHDLSFDERSILFRAALAEMVVPYGDPNPMHYWKHVMDAGEFIMGNSLNSLKLGCDCLGTIKYFDASNIMWDGTACTVKNGICLHEEDFGIGWKHTKMSLDDKPSVSRRMRRLVVSSFFTVDNYDYGFYWYLYLDGTIEVEVKLTGIVSIAVANEGTLDPGYAPSVTSVLKAPVHQHLFNFRVDWTLDGGKCSLYEDQVELVPVGDENPDGTFFRNVSRLLTTEAEAMRVINPENSRVWKIVNSSKKNNLGRPVAYKVLPGAAQSLLAHPDSVVGKRAAFARYNIWATPFHPEELSAAGSNPVMSENNIGLSKYTSGNRNIVDCDLVTWHTIGLTHVPRPEDWPVMPTEYCKLSFVPCGFFDRSPIIDLPCDNSKASKLVSKL